MENPNVGAPSDLAEDPAAPNIEAKLKLSVSFELASDGGTARSKLGPKNNLPVSSDGFKRWIHLCLLILSW